MTRHEAISPDPAASAAPAAGAYPMREYVADMSRELARMARADGDATLAFLLQCAADRASAAPGA